MNCTSAKFGDWKFQTGGIDEGKGGEKEQRPAYMSNFFGMRKNLDFFCYKSLDLPKLQKLLRRRECGYAQEAREIDVTKFVKYVQI